MLGHSNPRRFALLLALTSSLFAAQAAEVSPAERVETTPGLSPDAVRGVFNRQRQELARCMRVVYLRKATDPSRGDVEHVVWNDLPNADDRVQLRFALSPEGRVLREGSRDASFSVRGLYLDTLCVERILETWSFPAHPVGEREAAGGKESVQVEVWARFRTTAAERQAVLARMREDLTALCGALSALGSPGQPPAKEQWSAVISRLLAERGTRMDPRVRQGIEGMVHVNVGDGAELYGYVMEESMGSRIECPVVRSWLKRP
ncbi:hypothetical protein BO221_19045 [Archangium sp. Cb G35]|uniref:hypothetical protein n=1 Tax=Archangium sp. Cb G35 TaxID=1920190 RepID=UPI000935A422|nr:hypothetical protein [Archangium sp. Cb G35]OJT22992.1 hypothetical protein BO221_19045 [Archangium sp. Cb G35]